ncbi:ATP-binding protein [Kiloniella antarctica]|uniref:ATP-binding protein n=1 Tax=Kiloniella antarctica TaxID=1550907 RepID=A0ABW5BPC6_9PROT
MDFGEPRILLLEPNDATRQEIEQTLIGKNFEIISSFAPDEILFTDAGGDVEDTSPIGLILVSDEFSRDILFASSLVLGATRLLPQQIPVVVMTEALDRKSPLEMVINNWFHTIQKPFDPEILCSVVCAAINQFNHVRELLHQLETRSSAIGLITAGTFELRDLDEARNLTTMLTLACPRSDQVVIGLSELLQNAIEHGNLEIGFRLKSELLETGRLLEEIEERLGQAPYRERLVRVNFSRTEKEIVFIIQDEGAGFNWRKYLAIDEDRLNSSHGRGIALAKMMAFTELNYNGLGNRVTARLTL